MKHLLYLLFVVFMLAGCAKQPQPVQQPSEPAGPRSDIEKNPPKDAEKDVPSSLNAARRGFKTKLTRKESGKEPIPEPPADKVRIVRYDSPIGKLAAYLTPDPKDGKKHPALIWIHGDDCNTITHWFDPDEAAFNKVGIVRMFPSLRGGNDNPGIKESFLGEVDDVIAAAEYLSKQEFVDPQRIYLAGHSTGGTLVLLAAECSDRFRAVFSFGPAGNVVGYGSDALPFDVSNEQELRVRSPAYWLDSIRSPVFVIEGTGFGNIRALRAMARLSHNPKVKFLPVEGTDHFGVVISTTKLIAERIQGDIGASCNVTLTEEELSKPFAK